MILEHICQKNEVPVNSKPQSVAQIEHHLTHQLVMALDKPMVWLAVASRAVEAGYRKARRIKQRRSNLLRRINLCRAFIGKEVIVPDDEQWLETNLYYGYGACMPDSKYEKETGRNALQVSLSALLIANGAKSHVAQHEDGRFIGSMPITQTDSQLFQSGH